MGVGFLSGDGNENVPKLTVVTVVQLRAGTESH